ncbi:fimbria/pilus outer membrane usher protein [Rhodanobacter sp. MP7CTX1]|uniref:fimbria/pilus outer membrane usher protein n=1 Tax=Rhodanobacter sp. MP7CTX1 TaxID=2723084 RepID=UPI00161E87F0|nr:fimbria/pilus outer membrane usher protein [Rhodanobacter sp. MP7CTX1]MBB6189512.1 outer membrane usher protein [Rhodanobacter sp. MP7CTX1]
MYSRKSQRPRGKRLPLKRSYLLISAALAAYLPVSSFAAAAVDPGGADASAIEGVQFDDTVLMKSPGEHINVARFEHASPVAPGTYAVDLYVNGDWVAHANVRFATAPGSESAGACFDRSLVGRIGLDNNALSDAGEVEMARVHAGGCADLAQLVQGARQTFDMSEFRLDLSIPQVALVRNPRGYVNPELWDQGVTSATLGYNASTYQTTNNGRTSNQGYIALNAGFNIDGWLFRSNGTYTWQSGQGHSYQSIATYVQRDLPSIRSVMTIGDSYTDGAVFNSIGIRGVQVATDDRMLPDSLRGYAPVIRGVANTNAHVTVSQNGNTLYETNVAPGAFAINDLYATGYGGSLQVTVTEADGSKHSFVVPYTSVVQLLRPGIWRVNLAAGQVRDAMVDRHNDVLQATVQHGINNTVTGYFGVVAAQNYAAELLGAAFNTPIGAISMDLTQANAQIPGERYVDGQSFRVSYSKELADTNSNIAVAAYQFSSRGFWSLGDALLARQESGYKTTAAFLASGQGAFVPSILDRQRNQLQVTFNQGLGDTGGNLYLVGSAVNYWNHDGVTGQVQIGYNNTLHVAGVNLSYSLSASRQRDADSGQMTNQVFASLSLPLGRSAHAPMVSFSASHSDGSGTMEQASLTGTAGVDNQFTYGVNGANNPGYSSGGVNGQYRSPYTTLSANASTGTGYTQESAGLSGAIVAHPGGITLANSTGDTIGIVEAKDAAGARIENWPGVRIDGRGYAVIPYLTPYRINNIALDPKGIPLDVEMDTTGQQVAPYAGSVVMMKFGTVSGRAAIFSLRRMDGKELPFGADVLDEKGNTVSAVGQGGRVYLRGLPEAGTFTVSWGSEPSDRCTFQFRLPAKNKSGLYSTLDATCYSLAEASVSASAQMRGKLVSSTAAKVTPSADPANDLLKSGDDLGQLKQTELP